MLRSRSFPSHAVRCFWSITLAIGPLALCSHAGTVYYDAGSGDVFLDFDAPGIERVSGYQLDSHAGQFTEANYRRLGGATDLFLLSDSQIVEGGALVGGYVAGLYDLGPILASELSEADVTGDLSGMWAILGETTTTPLNVAFGRPSGIPLNETGIQQVDRWANEVTLSYFPNSGNLVVSSDGDAGGYMTIFRIEGSFTGSAPDNPNPDARFDSGNDFVELIGLTAPGTYDLGPILSPDLSKSELDEALTLAVFASQQGIGVADIQLSERSPMQIAFVPEPNFGWQVCFPWALLAKLCLERRKQPKRAVAID